MLDGLQPVGISQLGRCVRFEQQAIVGQDARVLPAALRGEHMLVY